MPKELGIIKGQTWAFREGARFPLVPALIVNQPAHYAASITIRLVGEPERGLMSVRRLKLPCKWERVDEYLHEHPEVPREPAPPSNIGPVDSERDPLEMTATDPLSVGEATIRRIVRQELERVVGVPRISFNYKEAALATGYSVSALRIAVQRGDLMPSYANSKPVFPIAELKAWVDALPKEPR